MKALLFALVLIGCENSTRLERHPWCSGPAERGELTFCVLKCAEAANPKSDEEGEDLVAQCEDTCRRVACPERWVTCEGRGQLLRCWLP